jgi:hypothetical protein
MEGEAGFRNFIKLMIFCIFKSEIIFGAYLSIDEKIKGILKYVLYNLFWFYFM